MSVDERLRRAFEATDPTWSSRAPGALREVTARHRRRVVLQRAAAAVTAVAAVGVGVLALSWNTDDRSAPAPATELPTRESPFPLDGTWVSQPISRGDVRRAAAA